MIVPPHSIEPSIIGNLDWLSQATSSAAIEAMRGSAGFSEVVLRVCHHLTVEHAGSPKFSRLMSDRGRLVFAIAVLYLHAEADESGARLTPGRIATFCRETGLCSAGRARATFALMRWLGHVEPDEPGHDGAVRSFRPTSQLIDRIRERWRRQFERLVEIRPEHGDLLAAVDRPEFLLALAVMLGQAYRAGYRVLSAVPSLAPVADRKSGLLILLALLLADQRGAPTPAIAELGRQFGVSRAHVHAVLRLGADANLLDWDSGRGEIAVRPALREAVDELFAGLFALFAAAGERAHARQADYAPNLGSRIS